MHPRRKAFTEYRENLEVQGNDIAGTHPPFCAGWDAAIAAVYAVIRHECRNVVLDKDTVRHLIDCALPQLEAAPVEPE